MKICQHCHKGSMLGHRVSHAKQRTKHLFKPNLHMATVVIKGHKKRMLLCVKCLKTLKKAS